MAPFQPTDFVPLPGTSGAAPAPTPTPTGGTPAASGGFQPTDFVPLTSPTLPPRVAPTPTGGFFGGKNLSQFIQHDVIGTGEGDDQNPDGSDTGFWQGLFQNTIGSKGVVGAAGANIGRAITTAVLNLSGAPKQVAQSKSDLSNVTASTIKMAQGLPDGDPRKTMLIQKVRDNFKAMGIADDNLNDLEKAQTTFGREAGTTINALLTLSPFGKAKTLLGLGADAGVAEEGANLVQQGAQKLINFSTKEGSEGVKDTITSGISKLFPKAAQYADKVMSMQKNLIPRMIQNGTLGSAWQSAYNLTSGRPATEGTGFAGLFSAIIPAASEGLARTFKNISSVMSGSPKAVLEAAYKNPDKVAEAVKSFATDKVGAADDLLQKTISGFKTVAKNRSDDYEKGLQEIEDAYRKTSLKPNTGTTVMQNNKTGETFGLSLQGMKSKMTAVLKDYGITGDTKTGFNFDSSVFPKADNAKVKEMLGVINGWKDITPTGLNNLGTKIGEYAKPMEGKAFSNIAYALKNNIRDYLGERIPEVNTLNKTYGDTSDFMKKLVNTFGTAVKGKNTGSAEATINKLLGIYSSKSNARQDIMKEFGERTGQDLMNEILGANLAHWGPKVSRGVMDALGLGGAASLAGFAGNPGLIVPAVGAASLASPRISGAVARTAGRIAPATSAVVRNLIPKMIGNSPK